MSEQEIDRYLEQLRKAPAAPAALRERVLDATPPRFDLFDWLVAFWWRPALTALAPLLAGVAIGLGQADVTPPDSNALLFASAYETFAADYALLAENGGEE